MQRHGPIDVRHRDGRVVRDWRRRSSDRAPRLSQKSRTSTRKSHTTAPTAPAPPTNNRTIFCATHEIRNHLAKKNKCLPSKSVFCFLPISPATTYMRRTQDANGRHGSARPSGDASWLGSDRLVRERLCSKKGIGPGAGQHKAVKWWRPLVGVRPGQELGVGLQSEEERVLVTCKAGNGTT